MNNVSEYYIPVQLSAQFKNLPTEAYLEEHTTCQLSWESPTRIA